MARHEHGRPYLARCAGFRLCSGSGGCLDCVGRGPPARTRAFPGAARPVRLRVSHVRVGLCSPSSFGQGVASGRSMDK